jgi:hypothetical protein
VEIKYLVFGGTVTSKNDGAEHFIGADRLMKLYGVKLNECAICIPNGTPEATKREQDYLIRCHPNAIILRPQYDGNYTLPRRST